MGYIKFLFFFLLLPYPFNFSDLNHKERTSNSFNQVKSNTIQGATFRYGDGELRVFTVLLGIPARLLGYDVNTGKLTDDVSLPNVNNAWDVCVSSDNFIYIAGSNGHLFVYDPTSRKLSDLGLAIRGETFIYDIVAGDGGIIYGGTYPNAKVFSYDSGKGFSTLLNESAVKGEKYIRSIEYFNKQLYLGVGSHAHLIKFNINTKRRASLLPNKYSSYSFIYSQKIIDYAKPDKIILARLTGDKNNKVLILNPYNQDVMELAEFDIYSSFYNRRNNYLYFSSKNNYYRLNINNLIGSRERLYGPIGSILGTYDNLYQGQIVSLTTQGEILKFNPTTNKMSLTRVGIPESQSKIHSLSMGPKGEVWTGGYLKGGNSTINPKTGAVVNFPGLGQTESTTFLGNDMYFGVYPKAKIYRYNTENPWDLRAGNPKLLIQIEGQDRPISSVSIPRQSKVFFGTVPSYGKVGGILLEIDENKKRAYTYHRVVENQSIISLDYNNGIVYGGTSIYGGAGSKIKGNAAVFGWNVSKRSKEFVLPLPGISMVLDIKSDEKNNLWIIADNRLMIMNPKNRTIIKSKELFNVKNLKANHKGGSIVKFSGNFVYIFSNETLYKIDRTTFSSETILRGVDKVTSKDGSELYYLKNNSVEMLRIK